MARARNIKPSFFLNEELVELPFEVRLLFIGLWTIADREGRMKDKPKQIKMSVFPADDVDVDAALTQLAQAKFIKRYVVKNERFIEVINFTKHQNPHVKEVASTIPAPYKHRARTRRALLIPDSLLLNPESKTESNKASSAKPTDKTDPVEERIWKDGSDLLTRSGLTKQSARSFLGAQAKAYGNEPLAEAIAATQAKNAVDPKAYIIAVLQKRGNASAHVGRSNGTDTFIPEPPCDVCGKEGCLKLHREERGI